MRSSVTCSGSSSTPIASAELGDEELTYDLSVPDNVTYVANGFVSHNTIGLMMDCDTTGIEPDLGLVKMKKLVGGGTMSIVNQTVPRALRRLGYTPEQVDEIIAYIDQREVDPRRAPPRCRAPRRLRLLDGRQHDPLRGSRADDGRRPAVLSSGSISKTVNMPEDGDRRGRRSTAPAVVGARSQGRRHLPRQLQGRPAAVDGEEGRADAEIAERVVEKVVEKVIHRPVRQKLPRTRRARTFEFRVADCKGFATIGEYDDGRPGEIFLTVSKQGSTLSGIMDAFAKLDQPTACSTACRCGPSSRRSRTCASSRPA